jgi:acetyl-CoA carboxylase biotin carboxylase subunit
MLAIVCRRTTTASLASSSFTLPRRKEALARLRRALDETVVAGVETTLPLHRRLASNEDIAKGDYDIHWLEKFLGMKK